METGDVIVLTLCLVASGFLIGLGIPCSLGLVPPNRLYGFRTPKTLKDPDVWYPTNRVAGNWGIATGIATAGVSLTTFFAGLGLPAAPLITLVPVLLGIGATLTHGFLVIRRVTREKQRSMA